VRKRKISPLVLLWIALAAVSAPTWAQGQAEELLEEGEVLEEAAGGAQVEEQAVEEGEYVEEEALPAEEPVQAAPVMPQPVRPAVRPVRPKVAAPARPARPLRKAPPPRRAAPVGQPSLTPAAAPGDKTGKSAEEPISFDFREEPLSLVIDQISRLTGRNFDVGPNVGAATVTVITHDKIPPEMAYEVLESILATRGFSLVEDLDGHLIKVIPTPDATTSEKTPIIKGSADVPEGYDNYATHIVSVKYADASELTGVLKLVSSKTARIDAYAPTNTLIITDTADGLRRIFSFLEDIDIPGFDTVMEIFTLEYTRAEVLSQQLEQVLLDEGGGPPERAQPVRRPTTTRSSRPVRPSVPGAPTSQVIGSRDEVLRMVPDERLNALIVVASEGMMERVRDLIKRLDTPTPYEANNLHIYELLNADAEQVEQAVQPLIGTAPRKAAAAGGGGGGAAAAGGTEVQPFEQKVQITRYDQTNSLLIVASPQDYKLLEAFIARLDVPQRQVYVDAVVMDVTMSDSYGVSVEAASVTGEDGFGLTQTTNLATIAQALAPTADAATDIASTGGSFALGLLGLGSAGGMTAGIFDDIKVDVNGEEVTIPFVPALFQAIETITDLEVLSQPSLVTVDNEEASIAVGQEVPFITSTSSSRRTDGSVDTGMYGGYTRVEREEVGVKLKVTPQISEGDNVLLEIEIEVSDVADQSVGTVDIVGPTTNKSLIQNRVLVKDGSTAVLAGLIRDTADRSRTQPPVLGDLPLLGWLFRNRSNTMQKRNMVVLVTPHIIKEGVDYERVTQYKVGEYHDTNIEKLMEMGFFKRVKKKAKMRKKHRPTYDRSEALTGKRTNYSFGRGDIPR